MSAARSFQDLLPASALDGSSLSLPELRKFCRECRLCASNQSPEKNSQMASPSPWRTRSQLWKLTVFWSTRANAGRKKKEKTEKNKNTPILCNPLMYCTINMSYITLTLQDNRCLHTLQRTRRIQLGFRKGRS